MAKHAYLAASASERWLKCPPSAKLCAQEEDRGSPYAQQGTDAHELAAYLAEHEAAGVKLDTECQEVRYVDGVYLLLRKSQGIWYITDVFTAEEAVGYEPIYFWQRIKRGASYILAHLLIGWRQLTRKAVAGA